ncbi:MAG: PEP-CTERM sorting domain-containing protein [Tepidisphaeraceae bacterium]
MRSRLSLIALAFTGLLVMGNTSQAAPSGPYQDFRGGVTVPDPVSNFTITIYTQFFSIKDRIIISFPPTSALSVNVGGLSYVSPSTVSGMDDITTFYGMDNNPGANPMQLTGFPAGFPGVFSNEVVTAGGADYQGTPLGQFAPSALASNFPGYDFSSFLGDGSVFAFTTTVPAAAVPEPASLGLLSAGVLLAAMRRRRCA